MVTEEMDMAVWKQVLAMDDERGEVDDERGEVRKKAMTQMLELLFPQGVSGEDGTSLSIICFYR